METSAGVDATCVDASANLVPVVSVTTSCNLPTALRIFAEWNPVSAVTQAARELFGNVPPDAAEAGAWSLQHPALYTLAWSVAIVAVFAPLAVRQYKNSRTKN